MISGIVALLNRNILNLIKKIELCVQLAILQDYILFTFSPFFIYISEPPLKYDKPEGNEKKEEVWECDMSNNKSIKEIFEADAREKRLNEMKEKAELDILANAEYAKEIAKIQTAQDIICQYLNVRFGTESQSSQNAVRTINNMGTLNRIINQIFSINQLDIAKALISYVQETS